MDFEKSKLNGLILCKPHIFKDSRGFFKESYNKKQFNEVVGRDINFVQDNFSLSHKGVFRGIHLQKKPFEQGKLVYVSHGVVMDYAIDLRKNSPTYLQWEVFELSDKNNHQLWIPEGFGHAFLAISDTVHFSYKTTNYYNKESEICVKWDDPKIGLAFNYDIELKISEKDNQGILL
jgi:dTDP-4-dehydrorhamnose 3,5-epimerase